MTGNAMTGNEAASPDHWRAFRLLLSEISGRGLGKLEAHLLRERSARKELEASAVRLFFSSLSAAELDGAQELIGQERKARIENRRICRDAQRQRKSLLRRPS